MQENAYILRDCMVRNAANHDGGACIFWSCDLVIICLYLDYSNVVDYPHESLRVL